MFSFDMVEVSTSSESEDDGRFEGCVVDVTTWTYPHQLHNNNNHERVTTRARLQGLDYQTKRFDVGVQTDRWSRLNEGNRMRIAATTQDSSYDHRNKEGPIMGNRHVPDQDQKRKQRETHDFYGHGLKILQSIIEKKLEFVTTNGPSRSERNQEDHEWSGIKLFSRSLDLKTLSHNSKVEKESRKISLDQDSSSDDDLTLLEKVVVTKDDIQTQAKIMGKRAKKAEVLLQGVFQRKKKMKRS